MSYVTVIANSILSQTESASVLGPEIYTAIAEWEKREIPLSVVKRSIEEVCGRAADANPGQIPVECFQEAVISNFRSWLATDGKSHASAA